jgi:hypothetical protein
MQLLNSITDWIINEEQNLFLTVLEAGKSKIKFSAESMSGLDCFPSSMVPLTGF